MSGASVFMHWNLGFFVHCVTLLCVQDLFQDKHDTMFDSHAGQRRQVVRGALGGPASTPLLQTSPL